MALVGVYRQLPDDEERRAILAANQADEAHLLELMQRIESYRTLISQLELAFTEVQTRIKLRDSQLAPHRYLPNELLSHIFSFIDHEPYDRFSCRDELGNVIQRDQGTLISPVEWLCRSPVNVSQVCTRWRRVALTTPCLWTDVVLDMEKREPCQMMKHWFQLARTKPVHVTIWKEDHPRDRDGFRKNIQAVAQMLNLHQDQLASLQISAQSDPDPFGTQAPLCNQDIPIILKALEEISESPLPSLKSLTLGSMDAEVKYNYRYPLLPGFSPQLLHNLTTLRIRGFYPSKNFFSCIPAGLTTLKLDAPAHVFTGTNETLQIDLPKLLSSLGQLERLRLTGKYPILPNDSRPRDPIHLPNLKRLTIAGQHCASYLRLMETPNLLRLKIKGGHVWKDRNTFTPAIQWTYVKPLISNFLEKNGSNVAQFAVSKVGTTVEWETLSSWAKHTTNLKRLTVTQETKDPKYPADFMRNALACYRNGGALEWRLSE